MKTTEGKHLPEELSGGTDKPGKASIEIRKAVPGDASFIAAGIMSAMGEDIYGSNGDEETSTHFGKKSDVLSALAQVCMREDTLYSYKNAYIAVCDGNSAGVIVAYDGAIYRQASAITFSVVSEILGKEKMEPGTETGAGEFYLDSLSVMPEFRGHGIGNLLIQTELENAQALGFGKVTLLVDMNKPWLHRMYSRAGFKMDGTVKFFGDDYFRMTQYV